MKTTDTSLWRVRHNKDLLLYVKGRLQARSHVFLTGRCDPKRRRTKRDRRSTSTGVCGGGGGGAGGVRAWRTGLSETVLQMF